MADFHAGKVIFDAELKGMQKVDAQLEQFRIRQQRIGRGFDKLYKEDYTRKFTENLKKGFETGFNTSIAKGENQMYAFSHAVGVAGSALSRIKSPVENAADSFQKLQKGAYIMQNGLGLLFSTIGDLAGGILGLVGVVGQALPAFVAFGGAIASVGSGFIGVKIAMSGVSQAIGTVWKSQTALNDTFRAAQQEYIDLKFAAEAAALSQEDAAIKLEKAREALARVQDLPPDNRLRRETELQFKQAELNYRETAHKSNEAYRAVKKGITATSAYQPLASLNAFQLGFVKFMVAFRPAMLQLTEMASKGFIPKLTEGIKGLMTNVFPVLEKGIAAVASAMGDAFITFTNAFKNTDTLNKLGDFFKSAVPIIKDFGSGMGSAFGILINLLKAAAPLTKKFGDWVDKYLFKLNAHLNIENVTGSLTKFFNLAGQAAAGLGTVFKNIKNALLNIVHAAFPNGIKSGAGGVWLEWLDKITTGFKNFTRSEKFSGWLKTTAENATTALSTVGQFLKIFLDLAGQKSTREFWETIRGAVAPIRQIFQNGGELGKTIGNVVVSLAKLLASLADVATLRSFFNTVAFIADTFAKIITNPAVSFMINLMGYAHGAIIAIVAVVTILKNFLAIMMGYIEKGARHVATLTTNVSKFRVGLEAFRFELRALDSAQKTMANGSAKDISRAFAIQAIRMGDLRGTTVSASSSLRAFAEINKRYVNELTGTTATTASAIQRFGRGLAYIPASFNTIYRAARITALMSREALRDARAMAAYEEARQMGMGTKELAKREMQVRATSAAYKTLIDVQKLEMEARLAEAEGNKELMMQKLQEIALIGEGTNAIHMDEAAAKQLAATYVKLAQDMGMSKNELTILKYELDQYIATNKNAIMTNEQMVASSQTLRAYDMGAPVNNPTLRSRIGAAFKSSKMGMGVGLGAMMGLGEVAQAGKVTIGSGMSALGMGLMFGGPEMLPASIALTAVGGIIDSIQNGIEQQTSKIKEIRIQNANIYNANVVDRSNYVRNAIRSGAFTSASNATTSSKYVENVAAAFVNSLGTSATQGYTGALKTEKDIKTLFNDILVGGGKKAGTYLSNNKTVAQIGQSAGLLSQYTGLGAEDIGTGIGMISKSASVSSVKTQLMQSGLLTDVTVKNIPDGFWNTLQFSNGQLTSSSLISLLNKVSEANSGGVLNNANINSMQFVAQGAATGYGAILKGNPLTASIKSFSGAVGKNKGPGLSVDNFTDYQKLVYSLSKGKATKITYKDVTGKHGTLDRREYYAGDVLIGSAPYTFGTLRMQGSNTNGLLDPNSYTNFGGHFSFESNAAGNALRAAGIQGQDISNWITKAANTASQGATSTYLNLDPASKKSLDNSAGSSANAAAEMAKLNAYFQQNFVALPDMMAVLTQMEKTNSGKDALKKGGSAFITEFQKELKVLFPTATPTSTKTP
jgi:hypothetical protein